MSTVERDREERWQEAALLAGPDRRSKPKIVTSKDHRLQVRRLETIIAEFERLAERLYPRHHEETSSIRDGLGAAWDEALRMAADAERHEAEEGAVGA